MTIEQVLKDYVILVDHIKSKYSGAENSPVIAFSGSYGGFLATSIRQKYPHIFIGYTKKNRNFSKLIF
jgi:lysosomal Pro-X carboxypeptidase